MQRFNLIVRALVNDHPLVCNDWSSKATFSYFSNYLKKDLETLLIFQNNERVLGFHLERAVYDQNQEFGETANRHG